MKTRQRRQARMRGFKVDLRLTGNRTTIMLTTPPPLPPKHRGGGGEINYKFGISSYYITTMYKILIKQQNNKNNKVLLHNSGNCIQYLAITYNGKEYEKEYMYS